MNDLAERSKQRHTQIVYILGGDLNYFPASPKNKERKENRKTFRVRVSKPLHPISL